MFNHSSRGRQKRLSAEREEMEQRIGGVLLSTVAEPLELEPEPEPEAHSAPQLAAPEVVEMPPQHTELGGGFGLLDDDVVVNILLHLPWRGMVSMAQVCRRCPSLCEHAAELKAQEHPNHVLLSRRSDESAVQLLSYICGMDSYLAAGARAVASAKHSALISAAGDVLSCGDGDAGRLGQGLSSIAEGTATLEVVAGLPRVVQVAAGVAHTAALDAQGRLWTWGFGEAGRLGHGESLDELVPRAVAALDDIRLCAVSAGGAHTAAVSIDGDLYMWGALSEFDEPQLVPRQLPTGGSAISSVSCGGGTLACVSRDGALLVCGHLVQTSRLTLIASPTANLRLHVSSVCVGGSSSKATSDFLAVLTVLGELYTLGHGEFGALGNGSEDDQKELRLVELFAEQGVLVRSVSCGAAHAAAISTNGALYVWGRGKYGRLGLGDRLDRLAPTQVEAFGAAFADCVACGKEHTIIGLRNGDVYMCGRGDDGRLGTGNNHRQSLPRRLRGIKFMHIPQEGSDSQSEQHAIAMAIAETDGEFVAIDEDVV
jgi:alpha-tubulin suppressor-like RCC1 family protein